MKIFVVNAGSSSLKYQLIDMENEQVVCKGLCDRIGVTGNSVITHKAADGRTYSVETPMPTHSEAFEAVVYAMTKSDAKVIDSFDEVSAIGHRIVQGDSAADSRYPEFAAAFEPSTQTVRRTCVHTVQG